MNYVLDTHSIVWFVENDPRLSQPAKSILQMPSAEFVIPTMVLIEIRHLNAKGRIKAALANVYRDFINARNCSVHPIDEDLIPLIPTGLDIHDSIIVATAIFYRDKLQLPTALITKDTKITQSGLIQTLW
ncbi:MAG: PIN domain-containing protein [Acidobacteriota bacterium]